MYQMHLKDYIDRIDSQYILWGVDKQFNPKNWYDIDV